MTEATSTRPYITSNGIAYTIDSLNDTAKRHASDLFKTVQEYRQLLGSYKQSLTVNNAYSSGLKKVLEESDTPVLFVEPSEDRPTIKVDDVVYDATELPDLVKASIRELVQSTNQKALIEYRLRQLDAARSAFVAALQSEIASSSPAPMDPQPESQQDS